MTDAETRRAVDAVAGLIRRAETADPDVLAAEIVAMLKARGWRHVESLSSLPDDLRTPPRPPPAEWLQAKAALTRRPA